MNILLKFRSILLKKPNPFLTKTEEFNFSIWLKVFHNIFSPDLEHISSFENSFQNYIGSGASVGFASGRMAFYAILESLNLNFGDEVLMIVPNCSVMFNAAQRTKAKIRTYDVDLDCLGSSIQNIVSQVNLNTRVIVVQHTLGIPCNIVNIKEFCHLNNIVLIEDCALTLGSKIDNISVGNFGDYSIFSFDNTKPLSAILGGMVYSNDAVKIAALKSNFKNIKELSKSFQFFILFYAFLSNVISSKLYWLYNSIYSFSLLVLNQIGFKYKYPYLYDDAGVYQTSDVSPYPYPAKLSASFACLGLFNFSNLNEINLRRKSNFDILFNHFKTKQVDMPLAYFDERLDIIPLRFVLFCNENSFYYSYLSNLLPRGSMWFISPLACCDNSVEFGIDDLLIPNCVYTNSVIFNIPLDNLSLINTIINASDYE
jgi:dTDP-4-amino-4,6-dideoxygalactose transaminase